MENRLYRSRQDRILGGVCGGLAKYLQIDTILIRLFFIVFSLVGGIGPIAYLVMWVLVPSEEEIPTPNAPAQVIDGEVMKERAETFQEEFVDVIRKPSRKSSLYAGITLVIIGGYIFLKNLNLPWLAWLNDKLILAALIILAGATLLVATLRKER
jgi:phage shock protein C